MCNENGFCLDTQRVVDTVAHSMSLPLEEDVASESLLCSSCSMAFSGCSTSTWKSGSSWELYPVRSMELREKRLNQVSAQP